jgi:DNA-binding beta-propeller fold protein YncE
LTISLSSDEAPATAFLILRDRIFGIILGSSGFILANMNSIERLLALFVVGLVLTLQGVPVVADDEKGDEQPVFFPPPPSEPRLQFLTKFSSSLDVGTKSKGFRDFVFGGEDNERALIEKPYGVAAFDGAVYVVDARGGGYGVFDVANNSSRFVRPSGAGALQKPINITIDADGTRYVTDTQREQVLVYDTNDRFVRAIGDPGQFRPVDVAIDGDRLYVTDVMHHQVHVLDKRTDEILLTFGEAGSDPGHLFHPTNLSIGSDGTIYVTDTTNFRVQQFTGDGEFLRTLGAQGMGFGNFARPKGVALDKEDRFYVVDAAFNNVQVFAPDTSLLMVFGNTGRERWNINLPTVVKIDYDNVEYFEKYAAPDFEIEYLVLVASQYGLNKVVVFGFGEIRE